MPFFPPITFSFLINSAGAKVSPFNLVGTPFSNSISMYVASSGAFSGATDK